MLKAKAARRSPRCPDVLCGATAMKSTIDLDSFRSVTRHIVSVRRRSLMRRQSGDEEAFAIVTLLASTLEQI